MTTASSDLSPLDVLILVWLLTKPDGGTETELSKALRPFLELRWSTAEQSRAIGDAVESLRRAGRAVRVRRAAVTLTEDGRRAGLAVLGMKVLPPRKKSERGLLKKLLLSVALGVPFSTTEATARRSSDMSMRVCAAILARSHHLEIGSSPTPKQAKDALVWRELGIATREPLTLSALHGWALNRALGVTKKPLAPDDAFAQAAARAVGARRADAEEIQVAVISQWVSPSEAAPPVRSRADAALAPSLPEAVKPLDDKAFAARVLEAARASKTGRFGEDKVFISHVFQRLAQEGAVADDAEAFKGRLVSAHRQRLLSISRADLVEAMDPKDVEASEARYLSETFHFVRIS